MNILTYNVGENKALLTCYLQDFSAAISNSEKRPAILILAGGGYEFVSDSEREPIAMAYAARGYQAFTLSYSVKEKGVFPIPQIEVLEAISLIRTNANEFNVNPSEIAVIGFSAGGHLAASVGVFWNNAQINMIPNRENSRPNALILVYPCITSNEYSHPCVKNIQGDGTKFPELLSVDRHVGQDTPPTFLCHTAEDSCVLAMNSLKFAVALAEKHVPYELHIYKEGPHAMSLGTKAVSSPFLKAQSDDVKLAVSSIANRFSDWLDRSVEFLNLVYNPIKIELIGDKLAIKKNQ